MNLQAVLFVAVLAIVPSLGILAIWYSGKQRRLDGQHEKKDRRTADTR
jgi:hypothetical protein